MLIQASGPVKIEAEPQNYYPFNPKIKTSDWSYAIAFNSDSSIMITGSKAAIKIYKFQNGELEEIQILSKYHMEDVLTLYFMKKSNQFISGSEDCTIIIWGINLNSQLWYCEQQLEGHKRYVNSVIMNRMEDIIISCSSDRSIKFWNKYLQWQCQQSLDLSSGVQAISLNNQENKLASLLEDKCIMIFEKSKNNLWAKSQTIQVLTGARLCFIGDSILAFQQCAWEGGKMEVFELDDLSKLFVKSKEVFQGLIKVLEYDYEPELFPLYYCEQKQLLVCKNGRKISIMRKLNNSDFVVEQQIEFGKAGIYGAMTHNGEYLVTWDVMRYGIQVWKSKQ